MATTFDIQLPSLFARISPNHARYCLTATRTSERVLLVVFIKHTSAGLTINENADPDVRHDFQTFLINSFPTVLPTSSIPLKLRRYECPYKSLPDRKLGHHPHQNHRLNLGTWQGVYLGEFRDGGDTRKLSITIL